MQTVEVEVVDVNEARKRPRPRLSRPSLQTRGRLGPCRSCCSQPSSCFNLPTMALQKCHINDLLGVDLMLEIFAQLIFTDNLHSKYPFHIPRSRRAPLSLTFVCSRWRKIALAAPQIWSSLLIDIEALVKTSILKRNLYQLWLERAWGTPVSLCLTEIRQSQAILLDDPTWINFLLEHVPKLAFLSTGPLVINALLRGLENHPARRTWVHLETLQLVFHPEARLEAACHRRLSSLFPNISQADLSLWNYSGFEDLPFTNLTHLSCNVNLFNYFPSRDFPWSFDKLLELFLYHNGGSPGSGESFSIRRTVACPSLKYLHIFGREQAAATLPHLSCPLLLVLEIEDPLVVTSLSPSPSNAGDFSYFSQFLQVSSSLTAIIVRSPTFLTTAFLKHPQIYANVPFVQVSIPTLALRFHTLEVAQKHFANQWKEQHLQVAFSVADEPHGKLTFFHAYVGWARIPTQLLGEGHRQTWSSASWDQEPYARSVRSIRKARIVTV